MKRSQYKISSHSPSEELSSSIKENTIEQSVISILDEEGFEIFQFTAGLLCDERPSLVFFDISEKKYKEISDIVYKSFK